MTRSAGAVVPGAWGKARGRPGFSTARASDSRREQPACFAPRCFAEWVYSIRDSNLIWRMSSSACGAPAWITRAATSRRHGIPRGQRRPGQMAPGNRASHFAQPGIFGSEILPGEPSFRLAWPILVSQTLWGLVALRHGCFTAFLRGKLAGVVGFGGPAEAGPGEDGAEAAVAGANGIGA